MRRRSSNVRNSSTGIASPIPLSGSTLKCTASRKTSSFPVIRWSLCASISLVRMKAHVNSTISSSTAITQRCLRSATHTILLRWCTRFTRSMRELLRSWRLFTTTSSCVLTIRQQITIYWESCKPTQKLPKISSTCSSNLSGSSPKDSTKWASTRWRPAPQALQFLASERLSFSRWWRWAFWKSCIFSSSSHWKKSAEVFSSPCVAQRSS